jgi:regulator of ribonuclease activity A
LEGIIVNGCIRDSHHKFNEYRHKTLNTSPVKSVKRNIGEIIFQLNITFISGDYIYADADGILLSKLY